MTQITFPLLKMTLTPNKIAFTILGINIHWYAIIIVASIILALFLCKKQDGKYDIKYEHILDLSIILLPIAFISARIYYVIFNLNNYTTLQQILNIKDGGLAIYGGIIRRNNNIIYILQKKKYPNFRPTRLSSTIPSSIPIHRQMGKLHKRRSLWNWN